MRIRRGHAGRIVVQREGRQAGAARRVGKVLGVVRHAVLDHRDSPLLGVGERDGHRFARIDVERGRAVGQVHAAAVVGIDNRQVRQAPARQRGFRNHISARQQIVECPIVGQGAVRVVIQLEAPERRCAGKAEVGAVVGDRILHHVDGAQLRIRVTDDHVFARGEIHGRRAAGCAVARRARDADARQGPSGQRVLRDREGPRGQIDENLRVRWVRAARIIIQGERAQANARGRVREVLGIVRIRVLDHRDTGPFRVGERDRDGFARIHVDGGRAVDQVHAAAVVRIHDHQIRQGPAGQGRFRDHVTARRQVAECPAVGQRAVRIIVQLETTDRSRRQIAEVGRIVGRRVLDDGDAALLDVRIPNRHILASRQIHRRDEPGSAVTAGARHDNARQLPTRHRGFGDRERSRQQADELLGIRWRRAGRIVVQGKGGQARAGRRVGEILSVVRYAVLDHRNPTVFGIAERDRDVLARIDVERRRPTCQVHAAAVVGIDNRQAGQAPARQRRFRDHVTARQ